MRDKTNRRTDRYGGSIENRARLVFEVTEAVIGVMGAARTGIHLSPLSPAGDIADSNPEAVFSFVVEGLNRFGLAYLHVVEGVTQGPRAVEGGFDLQKLCRAFHGPYISNNGYDDLEMARPVLREGQADAVSFGRLYISNPDLVERIRLGAALNAPYKDTFYGGDAHGYTDYPTLSEPNE